MKTHYKYLVIGAGPAGIKYVDKLIARGVSPDEICWIDPEFQVGAFGTTYADVPGNTQVKSYLPYLDTLNNALKILLFQSRNKPQNLEVAKQLFLCYTVAFNMFRKLDSKYTPKLKVVSHLLQDACDTLRQCVPNIESYVTKLEDEDSQFKATLANGDSITSDRVIFVPGAKPREVSMPEEVKVRLPLLPAENVFSQDKIQPLLKNGTLNASDKIAVIGSSHSAALAVMQLIEAGLKVVWLKRNADAPLVYAEEITDEGGTFIHYDNSGLKGDVAKWCKENEKNGIVEHTNLKIMESNEENLRQCAQACRYRVEVVGFEPSQPYIYRNNERVRIDYNEENGFACGGRMLVGGIAFPRKVDEHAGRARFGAPLFAYAVGLSKFSGQEIPEAFLVNKEVTPLVDAESTLPQDLEGEKFLNVQRIAETMRARL